MNAEPAGLDDGAPPMPARKAYVKPRLLEYGNVRELTRGAGTRNLDGDLMTRMTTPSP